MEKAIEELRASIKEQMELMEKQLKPWILKSEPGQEWHHRMFSECHHWIAAGPGIFISTDPYYGKEVAVAVDAHLDRERWHPASTCKGTT